jgi:hypothetical protein
VRVRANSPVWQNVLVLLLGQIAFWTALLLGISSGAGALAGFLAGAALAVALAMVPGFFSKLEALTK